MRRLLTGLAMLTMAGDGVMAAPAKPPSPRAQVKALAKGCGAAASYDLKGLEAGLAKVGAPYDGFVSTTRSMRGPIADPAPDDASVILRGVIGSSVTQQMPIETATTIWRDSAGVWQVSQVDHAVALPPEMPPPPPQSLQDGPDSAEGISLGLIKAPPDRSFQESRGKLAQDMATRLDAWIASPCFALELAGLRQQPLKEPMPQPCPADYASSVLEVTIAGRRRYLSTDCLRAFPSAAIADVLFYPSTDAPPISWAPGPPCTDCYRYYAMPAAYGLVEKTGDPALDAALVPVYAAYGRKEPAKALALLKPLATGTHPRRWLLLPMLARLQYEAGDLDGAALTASTSKDVFELFEKPTACDNWAERKAKYTYWPKWMRYLEAQSAVCESDLLKASKEGVDPMTLEIVGIKSGAINYRVYDAISKRETIRLGHPPRYPDD